MFVELLLGDKTQCVYTDVVKIPEDEGVPQGSALDPVLFSFFMNNIRKNMQLLYADFTRLAHLWIRLSGFLSAAALLCRLKLALT